MKRSPETQDQSQKIFSQGPHPGIVAALTRQDSNLRPTSESALEVANTID